MNGHVARDGAGASSSAGVAHRTQAVPMRVIAAIRSRAAWVSAFQVACRRAEPRTTAITTAPPPCARLPTFPPVMTGPYQDLLPEPRPHSRTTRRAPALLQPADERPRHGAGPAQGRRPLHLRQQRQRDDLRVQRRVDEALPGQRHPLRPVPVPTPSDPNVASFSDTCPLQQYRARQKTSVAATPRGGRHRRSRAGKSSVSYPTFQVWLVEPLQVATSTSVPSAVPEATASRQSVESAALVMVPFAFSVHSWDAAPVQLSITTAVPAAALVVPACMHMSP